MYLVSVIASRSLVNDDGVTSNGVMMQSGGTVCRCSENLAANDVESNSSGVVKNVTFDEKSVNDNLYRKVRNDLSTVDVDPS